MRVKPAYRNLGLRHEAYIVCSEKNYPYFRQVAQHMHDQGVFTGIISYEDEKAFTAKAKWNLRNSYHVIFMLSDGIVEESLEDPRAEPNLFLQIYGYVNKYNPFSISCVSVDGYHIRQGLTFPAAMRGFDGLHRKPYSTNDAAFVASDLCKELRSRFTLDRREKLTHLKNNGLIQHQLYYKDLHKSAIHSILACIFMLFILLAWGPLGMGTMIHHFQNVIKAVFLLAILSVLFRSAALKSKKSRLQITTATVAGSKKSTKRNRLQRRILFLYFLVYAAMLMLLFPFVNSINPRQVVPLACILILWHLLLSISTLIEALIMQRKIPTASSYLSVSGFFLRFRQISRWIRLGLLIPAEIIIFILVQLHII